MMMLSKPPPEKDGKKRKPQRRPPFMTRQVLREIGEVLRAEGPGRVESFGEVTIEALLAMEEVGKGDSPTED